MHKGNLKILREKADNPDMHNKLMREQPGFEACDVLSETSTASPADADADDDEEINKLFDKSTDDEWNDEWSKEGHDCPHQGNQPWQRGEQCQEGGPPQELPVR